MFSSCIRILIVCGALFILGSVRLPAQEAGGTIQGTVRNATGDAMPGATVTVINRQTGTRRVLATRANGAFEITGLPPGPYAVTADLPGFRSVTQSRLLGASEKVTI